MGLLRLLQGNNEVELARQMAEAAREATLQAATYTAIASVSAALLGALFGAVAAYAAREIQDRKYRRAELTALLRLLDVETHTNEKRMNFQLDSQALKSPDYYAPRTAEWDQIHVRLAQLLEDERLFKNLTEYYEQAQALNEAAAKVSGIPGAQYVAKEFLPKQKGASDRLRPKLRDALKAQEGTGRRSWWRRLLGG